MLSFALLAASAAAADGLARDSYGTLLYAAEKHVHRGWTPKRVETQLACIATATGHALRTMDPGRDRVVLVNEALSKDMVDLLATSWRVEVVDMSQRNPKDPNATFEWPRWEDRLPPSELPEWAKKFHASRKKKLVLDDPAQLGRKNMAWNLTRPDGKTLYKRAFFFDADILLLDHAKSRKALADAWALPEDKLYAMPAGMKDAPAGCFNGGFLMFSPGAEDFALLQRAVHDPSAVTLAHCPGKDQRLLNSVFAGRWTPLSEATTSWKKTMGVLGGPESNTIHFHHGTPLPWFPKWWAKHMKTMPPAVKKTCKDLFSPAADAPSSKLAPTPPQRTPRPTPAPRATPRPTPKPLPPPAAAEAPPPPPPDPAVVQDSGSLFTLMHGIIGVLVGVAVWGLMG